MLDRLFTSLIADNLPVLEIPNEMVVGSRVVVEEGNIDFVVSDEGAVNEWVAEVIIGHGVCVNAEHFVDPDLLILDLIVGSAVPAKSSETELTIITVDACKLRTCIVLLELLELDVLALISSYLLSEGGLEVN